MNMQKQQKNQVLTIFMRPFFFILMSLALFTQPLSLKAADFVYISDNLRVGVRPEPISGTPPISVVFTGMRLEVHEKSDGYIKITTDKGVTGWIKDIYVTEQAPAIIQLNRLHKKFEKTKKEMAVNQKTSSMLEQSNLALTEQLTDLKTSQREWSRERAQLMASQYSDNTWLGYVVALLLIVMSFIGGIFWYKSHVKKRLGGLQV
ncbi:MAG: TIGR04211 family SH3 domain-containing protein [Woeseiaceae bacterium]